MKPLLLLLAMLLTACGHIEYQPLATIDRVDHSRGYRLQHVFHDQQDDDLFLVLLFSGGGTRAAAFGYGVLEVLAATPITGHGKTASLLEKTDLVHGVSGGSILATYLGLHGKNTVPRFEREFLQQNLQSTVLRQLLSLANLPRLTSSQYGRGDLLAEELDRLLYHGATFADLAERRQGPFAVISATDMSLGQRVEFTQEHFDALCLDLNRLPIARAVAASSAVPLIFAPITLNNHGGHCHYQPPPRADTPTIYVDAGLGMSLGKAAAQVGHGSMLLAAHQPFDWVQSWARRGFELCVVETDPDGFAQLVDAPGAVTIRDIGYTEVAPNTATVVASPRPLAH